VAWASTERAAGHGGRRPGRFRMKLEGKVDHVGAAVFLASSDSDDVVA
jgi:hypothetical protein